MVTILEKCDKNIISFDIYSKLLQSRIIFINKPLNAQTVGDYTTQLLYLSSLSDDPIDIYINSPGGSVYDCLGLYDLMQHVQKKGITLRTINVGLAASAAAVLLLAGSKGHRDSFPHCRIMLHQPSSGTAGTVTDMEIDLKECQDIKNVLNNIIKEHTCDEVLNKIERDYWLSPEEAVKLNIIDKVL